MKKKTRILLGITTLIIVFASITLIQLSGHREKEAANLNTAKNKVLEDFNYDKQPVKGSKDAPVKIVEFTDYKCSSCKRWTENVLPQLEKEYIQKGKAAVYILDYPFLAPDSKLAALAGETLYQQNHEFFEIYHKLMRENQKKDKSEWITKDFILNLVKEGIPDVDLQQFEKDLDAGTYLPQIKKDKEIGKELGIPGTPTVFVNGVEAEKVDYETLKTLIEQELIGVK
ncbi:DsbA family protein [Paenibacillus larvae]|uniref:DsbA family protein n=1 Tax=Paenibacillus larvae TaxID=1464 RepID=UPI0022812313|nr:DsbA family protein [Paenibacillus larvae]MCY9747995.1 DsbA family protein [Paenibacillus larvae]MCY9750657.1 DsbA family protein [Paenibacillus larvae]